MQLSIKSLPRRQFLAISGAAGLGDVDAWAYADEANARLRLRTDLGPSWVTSISPDGRKLCVEAWSTRGYPIRILETETGRELSESKFAQRTNGAEFFGDSNSFLATFAPGAGGHDHEQVRVDVRSGARISRRRSLGDFDHEYEVSYPAQDMNLVIAHYTRSPYRLSSLAVTRFTDYAEVVEAKLPAANERPMTGLWFSGDRTRFAYVVGQELFCRRANTLEIIWSKVFDGPVDARQVSLSADGSFLAVALADSLSEEHQRVSYCVVYNLASGEQKKVSVNGASGLGVSPDGQLLAVSQLERGRDAVVATMVRLFHVASGRQLASVVHDKVKDDRRAFLLAGCRPSFTPDGKFLVSAGRVSKIWEVLRSDTDP